MTDPDRLAAEADRLLREVTGTVTPAQLRAAGRLGADAAALSYRLGDAVGALTGAAAATDCARAQAVLRALPALVDALLDGYQRGNHAQAAAHDRERDRFIDDLLSGHTDPGRLAARAQRYGVSLAGRHVVIAARAPGLSATAVHAIDDALVARFGAANTMTRERDGELVCVAADGLRGVPAELARQLLAYQGSGWQLAVGRAHPGLAGLATSLREARDTLDLAGRLGFTAPVLHASDLLVFPVLLRDRDAMTDLVDTVLGPLRDARGGAAPLLETLGVLFEQQGNHTAAARVLHVSVRAVSYRLDRIRALTGYHPGEPTQRFTLHTAVLGAKLLGWPADEPPG
ncbi:PucR family transcriptional regulator [Catellatospora tritici]|uniref:PucR family transcriptional regulator n=1 Tax=Catellatospora tritici TaxID=2851566 RepID=UPI001C2D1919|nr:helix-turn-helix domain-containing protein [Catellatospora tritici]MBV1851798.1 helix-turn-helix domain-containing protein [Catellatospora tritici]